MKHTLQIWVDAPDSMVASFKKVIDKLGYYPAAIEFCFSGSCRLSEWGYWRPAKLPCFQGWGGFGSLPGGSSISLYLLIMMVTCLPMGRRLQVHCRAER